MIFVPYSQHLVQQRKGQEKPEIKRSGWKEFMETLIIPGAAAGGALLLLLILVTIIGLCKRKTRDPKRINDNTDENHTYGTYARGCDGDYEYDVAEVVDNNDLYGAVDCSAREGIEIHDKNGYYVH